MSETNTAFDLVVISAFGRGQWIATELAGQGWKTSFVDVTEQVGKFDFRDIEGPFGLFESQDLLPSQRARLADEGELVQAPTGFAVWLPEGPLEFRSELTPFLLRAREIPEEVETYIRHSSGKATEAERERRNIKKLQYSHSWLAQFAHSFTSATHHENHIAIESSGASPLFSAFALRQLTASGIAKGFLNAQTAGVTIRQKARIKTVSIPGNNVESVDLDGEFSGIERGRAFVWCLSFNETKMISETLAKQLFPDAWPEAQWGWQRISFKADSDTILESLPLSTVVIEDIDLTWTRANMILLRRRAGVNAVDAWVKVPNWMRNEPTVFDGVRNEVRGILEKRLPFVNLTLESLELSPRLWPVYTIEDFKKISSASLSNFFFDSPGFWPSIDWLGRFKVEGAIIDKLEKLKNMWDTAARKAEVARERQTRRSAQQ